MKQSIWVLSVLTLCLSAFGLTEDDIDGRWEKPCYALNEMPEAWAKETFSLGSPARILITKTRYSAAGCPEAKANPTQTTEMAFEDGWDSIAPKLDGNFVRGWRGLFAEGSGSSEIDYEAIAHLAEENGNKVLYLRWSVQKPAGLDSKTDRYVFLGHP